jgi:uncharacterized membrane protein
VWARLSGKGSKKVDGQRNDPLDERMKRLERDVEEMRVELRHVLQRLDRVLAERGSRGPEAGGAITTPLPAPKPAAPATGPEDVTAEKATVAPYDSFETRGSYSGSALERKVPMPFNLRNLGDLRSGEWWLNKIGIGLLLLGVAFLYLLSVERGWITPPVRLGFGLAIGASLLVLGLRVYGDRRAFAQVLLGGAIGAFYITGFAAYQLYALASYPLAFAFMVAVTLLAYVFSLRQNEVPLSLIGALGGLGTPFLLYSDTVTLGGLVLYTCVILVGMAAIYFYKGWISLLTVSSAGGWLVFVVGYVGSFSFLMATPPLGDRWALQLGVTFVWLLFWLVPVVRELLYSSVRDLAPAQLYAVATPIITLGFTDAIWKLSSFDLSWITLSAAAVYALTAIALRSIRRSGQLSYTHALVALLLLTLSLVLMLDGNALLFTLAAEAAVLHYMARQLSDRIVSAGAHFLFFVAATWLAFRIVTGVFTELEFTGPFDTHLAGFNVPALVDFAVIALAFGVSPVVVPGSAVRVYRVLAHTAALVWLARELLHLTDGDTWVLVSWALYAAGLHLLTRRLQEWETMVGAHTLSAIVALWLGTRLVGGADMRGSPATAVFNLGGISDLAIIALLALTPLTISPYWPRGIANIYRLAVHVAFLAWLWRELSILPGGDGWVTVAWGLYAVGLLIAGLRLDYASVIRGGMVTLFIVVGKLFLVDLAEVEAIWRVLLFLGFGGLFLTLSYYLRSLWKPKAGSLLGTAHTSSSKQPARKRN